MSYCHVSWARTDAKSITRADCPDCKTKTRFLGFFQDWYGWTETCLRCGRQYGDGEWIPLDFYRYARRDNIRSAKKRWRKTQDAEVIVRRAS